MGTQAYVTLPAHSAARLDEAADIVEAVFADIEQKMSLYRTDSELAAINCAAGMAPVAVSPVTLNTVALALNYARLSNGLFDPTMTPLLQSWRDAATDAPEIPDAETLAQTLTLVDFRRIEIDTEATTVFLQPQGMVLDLGGIAKGAAADLAAAALESRGYDAFLIDLGGDIRCAGAPTGHSAWRVGIRNPFDPKQLLGVLRMQPLPAVTTSGNYERFIEINGERFSHIIDPRTGQPAQGMAGVTVAAENAGKADALSTALFVAGLERAPQIIARASPVEALLIPDRLPVEIWVTPGFDHAFEPNPEYRNAIRPLSGNAGFNLTAPSIAPLSNRSPKTKNLITNTDCMRPFFSIDKGHQRKL